MGSSHHGSSPASRRTLARGAVRRGGVWLAVLSSLGLAGPADANGPERWRPNPVVGVQDKVTLRIHWFNSTEELREYAKTSGHVNQNGLHGYSILKRNTKTGEYVCDVYVVKMTKAYVDGDLTTTFGHEVLHCFGLRHE